METVLAVLAVTTALLGFFKELLAFLKENNGQQRRRVGWVITWGLSVIVAIAAIVTISVKNRDPSAFLFTRVTDFDPAVQKYSIFQVQSFYQPWTLFPAPYLVRQFKERSAPLDAAQATIQAAYFSSDLYSMKAFPSSTTRDISREIQPGEQNHVVLDVTNGFAPGSEKDDWYECSDWSGLNYFLRGPERLNELVVAIDFSPLTKTGSCENLFSVNTKPRIVWADPSLTIELAEKRFGHQITDVCGGRSPYQDMTNVSYSGTNSPKMAYGPSCLWVAKLEAIKKGRVSIIWKESAAFFSRNP